MTAISYSLDHTNGRIIATKDFLKHASVMNTEEYRTLVALRKDFPDYEIIRKTINQNDGQKRYKGLTENLMREYITAVHGMDSQDYALFNSYAKTAKAYGYSFGVVKKWFLDHYDGFSVAGAMATIAAANAETALTESIPADLGISLVDEPAPSQDVA